MAGLKVIHLYRSYLGSGFQARCEMELVCSSQARQVPKKSVFLLKNTSQPRKKMKFCMKNLNKKQKIVLPMPLYNHRLERTGCHSIFSRSFFFHWFCCHQKIKLHSFEKLGKKLFGKNDWRAKQGVPSPSEPSRERSVERRNNSPSKSNQPPRQWQIWFDCSWLSESDEGSIK